MRNSSAKQELLDSQARLDECRKKITHLEEANLGLGQRADNLERFTPDRNITNNQGGITCGAIDEPRKSSKVIDERVIINFCDKNVVNARFRDKNGGFIF